MYLIINQKKKKLTQTIILKYRKDGMNNDRPIQINPEKESNLANLGKIIIISLCRVNSEKKPHQTNLGKRISDTR